MTNGDDKEIILTWAEIKDTDDRLKALEAHTKYGTIEQVLKNIDKMKKTWDENIECFLEQMDDRFDIRDKQIAELNENLKASLDYTTRWTKEFMNAESVLRDVINYLGKYEANEMNPDECFKAINRMLKKLDSGRLEK